MSPMRRVVLLSSAMLLLAAAAPARPQDAAGGPTTVVSPVEVIARPEVPVPMVGEGATLFSPFQLQKFACQQRRRGSWVTASKAAAALAATETAQQVRREAAMGSRTQREVEAAELTRQAAVRAFQNEMVEDRMYTGWLAMFDPAYGVDPGDIDKAWPLANDDPDVTAGLSLMKAGITGAPGVGLGGVKAKMVVESGKEVLLITGQLRNGREGRGNIPALLITVLDQGGRVIDYEFADPQSQRIPAAGSVDFAYRLTTPPRHAQDVRVTLAPRLIPATTSRGLNGRVISGGAMRRQDDRNSSC